MRRLVSLLLSFCILTVANAEYTNYFVKGTEWTVVYSSCEPGSAVSHSTYSLEGKKTIAGHRCSQYCRDGEMLYYIYTEGDKVYVIRPEAEDESLLIYDFGLTIGDTVCVNVFKDYYYGDKDRHSRQICVGKGLITSCDRTYEYLEMEEIYEGYEDLFHITNYWIKGLGGIYSFRSDFANWAYDSDGGGGRIETITSYNNTLYSIDDMKIVARQATPPRKAEVLDATITAESAVRPYDHSWAGKLCFVNQDVYVQGLSEFCPESWVKGTISTDESSATFASPQWAGFNSVNDPVWITAPFPYAQTQFVMDWDPETCSLYCEDGYLENYYPDEICHYDDYRRVRISLSTPNDITIEDLQGEATEVRYNINGLRMQGVVQGLSIRNGQIELRR